MIATLVAAALVAAAPAARATPAAQKSACVACHADWSNLPAGHPAVKGKDLSACLPCHAPSDAAAPNKFSAALHRAHAGANVDCKTCHGRTKDGRVTVAGTKAVLGKLAKDDEPRVREVVGSFAGSAFLDATHGKAGVSCAGCHGGGVPETGSSVANDRCLACHGPMDALAAKSAPAVHADRNPHQSHLGEIDCTVCHHAHAASEIYCLHCHPKFEMKLPDAK